MNGGAGDTHAVLERLTLRIEAGKRRQQRRMDVQDPCWERVQERAAHDPHEAGQAHEADVARRRAPRAPDRRRLDRDSPATKYTAPRCRRPGALKPWSVAAVRDDNRDRGVQRPSAIASMIDCRLLPRPEMRTAMRRLSAVTRSERRGRRRRPDRAARAALRSARDDRSRRRRRQPNRSTMRPMPMLNVRNISSVPMAPRF